MAIRRAGAFRTGIVFLFLLTLLACGVKAVTAARVPPPIESLAGVWEFKGSGKSQAPDGTLRTVKFEETWTVVVSSEPGINIHWMDENGEGDYTARYQGGALYAELRTKNVTLVMLLHVKGSAGKLKASGIYLFNDFLSEDAFAGNGKISGVQVSGDE